MHKTIDHGASPFSDFDPKIIISDRKSIFEHEIKLGTKNLDARAPKTATTLRRPERYRCIGPTGASSIILWLIRIKLESYQRTDERVRKQLPNAAPLSLSSERKECFKYVRWECRFDPWIFNLSTAVVFRLRCFSRKAFGKNIELTVPRTQTAFRK